MTFSVPFATIFSIFWHPHFGIVFSSFFHNFRYPWYCKNLILTEDSLQKTRNRMFEKVPIVQLILTQFVRVFGIIFPSIFHTNFMFFQKPSRRPFLEARSAGLSSKVRFWSHFGISGNPKINPWGDLFAQKGDFSVDCFRPEASWNRTGRDLVPKTSQNDPRIDFYRF